MQNHSLQLVDEFAPGYDQYIQNCGWYGPDMLFGMMYEYLSKDETILDFGIGTGLNAILFHKAGLNVYGIDGSDQMLAICKAKNIAKELMKADLVAGKIPFSRTFHHATSFAVFHFLGDLSTLFKSVGETIFPGGSFGFSFDLYQPEKDTDYLQSSAEGVFEKTQPDSGLVIYKHSVDYIAHILKLSGLAIHKNTEICAFFDPDSGRTVYFQLVVAVKQ